MDSFDAQRQKAFEHCSDAAKQIITLSTTIIVITIAFAKDFVPEVQSSLKIWAYFAWAGFFVAILCGIMTLQALTAALEPKKLLFIRGRSYTTKTVIPSIRSSAESWSMIQMISFILAMLCVVIFGISAAREDNNLKQTKTEEEQKLKQIEQIILQ